MSKCDPREMVTHYSLTSVLVGGGMEGGELGSREEREQTGEQTYSSWREDMPCPYSQRETMCCCMQVTWSLLIKVCLDTEVYMSKRDVLFSPICFINFFLIKNFLFLNNIYWAIVDLQCCVCFCYTAKWLGYIYILISTPKEMFLHSLKDSKRASCDFI